MRRTPLNHYSLKKIAEINDEAPIRIALCKRAGGTPIESKGTVYHSGKPYRITRVRCWGGKCECGCNLKVDEELHPHEKVFRSKLGKLTMSNSIMVINSHHGKLQNNEQMWSSKEKQNG